MLKKLVLKHLKNFSVKILVLKIQESVLKILVVKNCPFIIFALGALYVVASYGIYNICIIR